MIKIDKNLCTGCGRCVMDCVAENLVLQQHKAEPVRNCFLCGHCVAICPEGAVSIPEYDMADVEELSPEEVRLDTGRLLSAIKFRRSIRSFQTDQVAPEHLEVLIQAGRYAATAKNTQGCRFIFVQNELETFKSIIWDYIGSMLGKGNQEMEVYRKFYEAHQTDPLQDFLFRNAPAVLFVAAKDSTDSGLAAQNMELAGNSLGLGFLYNGYLRRLADKNPEARAWLGADDRILGVCALVGYPVVRYRRTAPRKKADVVFR